MTVNFTINIENCLYLEDFLKSIEHKRKICNSINIYTVGADELVTLRIIILCFYVYTYVFIQFLLFFTKMNINMMVNTCVIDEIL